MGLYGLRRQIEPGDNSNSTSLALRYYGDSHPTEDVSVANLRYLSSRQALLDIVALKAHIMQQYKLTKENKWIAFGGSYSGEGGQGENTDRFIDLPVGFSFLAKLISGPVIALLILSLSAGRV